MNLLFITRRVDPAHPLAGFAESWVREFGEQLSVIDGQLNVITWQEGSAEELPENVKVYAVRNDGINRVIGLIWFIGFILKLISHCDAVFVHQHPVYAICAAPFAKLFRKKIYLWYVHKHVDAKLKFAVMACRGIFTASKESFRLKTKKPVYIVGHGINTAFFKPQLGHAPPWLENSELRVFHILSVGRISPVKGYETLIDAVEKMKGTNGHSSVQLRIAGGPGLKEHEAYYEKLKQFVKERELESMISFVGPVPHTEVIKEYQNADVFVNLSGTGSLDKTVLEAMACGVPVITSNEAFQELLQTVDKHLFVRKDPEALAAALERIVRMPAEARMQLGGKLRSLVVRDHNLKNLVQRILEVIEDKRIM